MDFFLNTKAVQCLQDNCKWITCLYKSICNTCTPKIRKENFTSLSLTPNTGLVTYTCACECSNHKFKNAFFSLFILITQHTPHTWHKKIPPPSYNIAVFANRSMSFKYINFCMTLCIMISPPTPSPKKIPQP